VDKLVEMLPFLALGVLGVATLVAAIGTLWGARRAEELGEGRFELLRDQHERLELLREERRMLPEELERRERLEAQSRVKQLMREHPHLELEQELQRVTEELELEREGRRQNTIVNASV
jgi:hypothetical protein